MRVHTLAPPAGSTTTVRIFINESPLPLSRSIVFHYMMSVRRRECGSDDRKGDGHREEGKRIETGKKARRSGASVRVSAARCDDRDAGRKQGDRRRDKWTLRRGGAGPVRVFRCVAPSLAGPCHFASRARRMPERPPGSGVLHLIRGSGGRRVPSAVSSALTASEGKKNRDLLISRTVTTGLV